MTRRTREGLAGLAAAVALLLVCGCNEILDPSGDNPYSGGSIPTGHGPVTAAGFVVDAGTESRAGLRGVSVALTDSSGARLTNRTDRRGIFYIDGLQPGLVAFEVTREGYEPFVVSVDVGRERWITATVALVATDQAPNMSMGGDYRDYAFEIPDEMPPGGEPVTPAVNAVAQDYAAYASYVCVSDAVVLDASAALIALASGTATLHGFLAGAHFDETVTVRDPSDASARRSALDAVRGDRLYEGQRGITVREHPAGAAHADALARVADGVVTLRTLARDVESARVVAEDPVTSVDRRTGPHRPLDPLRQPT